MVVTHIELTNLHQTGMVQYNTLVLRDLNLGVTALVDVLPTVFFDPIAISILPDIDNCLHGTGTK